MASKTTVLHTLGSAHKVCTLDFRKRKLFISFFLVMNNFKFILRMTKALKNILFIFFQKLYDVAVHFSKCCSPVPGDEIIGFVTRGRGVSIHRTDCVNVMNMNEADRQRIIEAEWQVTPDKEENELYDTELVIYAYDRIGVLLDLTKVFTESGITINNVNSRTSKQGIATITIGFAIRSVEALHVLTAKLRQVESVKDIQRTHS